MKSDLNEQAQVWERLFFLRAADPPKEELDLSGATTRLREAGVRRILDVGCGLGRWSLALARAGFQVTAVDIVRTVVERLRALAEKENLALAAFVCPAQKIPMDQNFDAVIANSVLDHMFKEEAEETLRRINFVLRRGGLLFLGMDGPPDEEDEGYPHRVFPDGTWQFFGGRRDGMLWRYWPDEEIRGLLWGLEIKEWTVRPDGSRKIWAQKF